MAPLDESADSIAVASAMARQRHGRRVALDAAEVEELLASSQLCRLATSRGPEPHVTPMWYVWDGGRLWMYSIVRSKRWRDVMANPTVAVVIDAGEAFSSYRGVELKGRVRVVGDVPRLPTPDAALADVERQLARKYNGCDELEIDGRHAWLCLEPTAIVSWHFGRLLELRDGVAFNPVDPG